MKRKAMLLVIGLTALSGVGYGAGDHPGNGTHWGYKGEIGPDRWATLKPEFGTCSGKNQSPINLIGMIEAEMKPVEFGYKEGGHEVINNGHAIQVNFEAGSSISMDGTGRRSHGGWWGNPQR